MRLAAIKFISAPQTGSTLELRSVNEINENEKNKMPNTNTIAKVFDTVLSIRGMNDNVKNSTLHSRKKCCALKQSN
jgi:hypothetical protein